MNDPLFVLSAFALGALHALEPGHGKTVVAAYLIGSRGRVRDAFALGGTVTFAHTSTILLLGILTTVAAAYFVPETVHGVMEVVSSLLVLGVGVWMVNERILRPRMARADDAHGHDHHHCGSGADHEHGHHGSALLHQHTHDQPGAHLHEHQHSHDPAGGHIHDHSVPAAERRSFGGLLALGLSGGIVPCPAALALLLAAAATGNFIGGLSLVVVFSLGLAAVLIAIGVLMVRAADFASHHFGDRLGGQRKLAYLAGVSSALVVTLLGVIMAVRAIVDVSALTS